MYYQNKSNPGRTPDLNHAVDQKDLLEITSKLCVFALHTVEKPARLKRILITTNLMATLCRQDENGYNTLMNQYKILYKAGQGQSVKDGNDILLDFANALKMALDILGPNEKMHSEDWKKALKEKLEETRTMLRNKKESLERKMQKSQDPTTSLFAARQKKSTGDPTQKLKTSTNDSHKMSGFGTNH